MARDGDEGTQRTARLEVLHQRLRLSERLASIGTLAAGLCHDMSNLLMPIRVYLDALEADGLTDRQQAEMSAVRTAVDFLQQLTNGLRLFALDPDDPEACPGRTDLVEWWAQLKPLMSRTVAQGIELQVDLPGDLPPVGVAAHRLTQAVLNVLINASEAVGGDGRVLMQARVTEDDRFVKLSVSDDGRGMSRAARQHALDPFFTTKKRSHSTGLGLSLVHGIVHAAGGRVDIDSASGKGTTITMNLPSVADVEAAEATPPPESGTALVAVSDPRVAACFTSLLTSAGFAIVRDAGGDSQPAVWVGDATLGALARARSLRDAAPACRLIAYGGRLPEWGELGATVIDRSAGLSGIREAVRQLALAAQEHRE